MSWDVVLIKTDSKTLDKDMKNELFPPNSAVIVNLKEAFPQICCDNPEWMILCGDGFSMEISVDAEKIECIMLFVRGEKAPLDEIRKMSEMFGAKAFDCSTGELLSYTDTSTFEAWKRYRNKVINNKSPEN